MPLLFTSKYHGVLFALANKHLTQVDLPVHWCTFPSLIKMMMIIHLIIKEDADYYYYFHCGLSDIKYPPVVASPGLNDHHLFMVPC